MPRTALNRPVAYIYSGGDLLYTIDLNSVASDYTLTIPSRDGGSNVVFIRHGEICVSDADCPDKTCVNTGFIHNSALPIVCIPHKLEIMIEDGINDIDGVVK